MDLYCSQSLKNLKISAQALGLFFSVIKPELKYWFPHDNYISFSLEYISQSFMISVSLEPNLAVCSWSSKRLQMLHTL